MALVIVMGVIVAGCLSVPDVMCAHAPILSEIGLNTSIVLWLAGVALLSPRHRSWLGGFIAAISTVVMAQYLFAWMPPDGFWRVVLNVDGRGLSLPRRMPPLAAFSMLCAGLALATLDRSRKLPGQILSQVAPGLILAAAVGGILNHSLDGLLFVATVDRDAVMNLPITMAMCVLVSGYLAAMVEAPWFRRFYAAREERQVLAISLTGLAAALLLGSAAAVAVLGKQMQVTVENALSSSVQNQAEIFSLVVSSALNRLQVRADGVTSRTDPTALLRDLAGPVGSAWLAGVDGPERRHVGQAADDLQFRLRLEDARPAWLIWKRGWLLEVHFPAAQGHGTIVVQEPLPLLEHLFTEDAAAGLETRLCKLAGNEHMACFPSVFMPRPQLEPMRHSDEQTPMGYALKGQRGVAVASDSRGEMVVAAYVPVAELGLGMVRKIDAEKLYQPMRITVWRTITVITGIGLIAALLIYLRVRFVVRRAVETGRQLRGVLDVLPVGVWVTDASGHFILNNPAGSGIWTGECKVGIKPCGECKGWWHDTGKRIGADDWASARAIKHGETSLDEVIDIECFDGSHKVISNSALPLHDEKGAIAGAVVVFRDITERMRTDAEIRHLERKFHSLAENLPDIVSRFDSDLRRIYVNPAVEKSIGMSQEFLLGKTCTELGMTDKEAEIWTNALRRVLFTGEPEVFEFGITTKEGVVRYYHTRAVPEYDVSGRVESVLTIARDISTLKGAELILRESEERLHGITSNVPGMMFQCCRHAGGELQFTYVSNGAKWLLGLDAAAILRENSAFIGLVVAEDAHAFHDSLAQSQKELSFWNWEGRIVTADGEARWINLRATPRRYGEDVCLWDGVAINITESKTSEEELVNSKNMLRELSAHLESVREEERKRIAREIHDELGQTLTALRMDVSLARLSFGESNPQLMARLQSMTQLVDRTIKTARHVTSSLRPGALDLGIVAALEWLVEEFIGYAGIPCELVLGDGDISLGEFSATAVFRIIQESLTNIARHAEATQAEILVASTDGHLCFEVSDNGKGFEPHTVANRKSFGLVGIRERVAMMEGVFELDSEPGRGTRIRVCVPVA
jgi:hypothetical protein